MLTVTPSAAAIGAGEKTVTKLRMSTKATAPRHIKLNLLFINLYIPPLEGFNIY
jgi:hypothetical protein